MRWLPSWRQAALTIAVCLVATLALYALLSTLKPAAPRGTEAAEKELGEIEDENAAHAEGSGERAALDEAESLARLEALIQMQEDNRRLMEMVTDRVQRDAREAAQGVRYEDAPAPAMPLLTPSPSWYADCDRYARSRNLARCSP